jgi:hypothetical protein
MSAYQTAQREANKPKGFRKRSLQPDIRADASFADSVKRKAGLSIKINQ